MAGIFAQTVVFGATITGDEPRRGPAEGHHRPVPVAADGAARRCSSAAPLRDVGNNVIVLIVMALTGLIVGWRIHTVVRSRRSLGFLLLLLFAYAISWVMAVRRAARCGRRRSSTTRLHRDLPAHVHRQHVRARPTTSRRC